MGDEMRAILTRTKQNEVQTVGELFQETEDGGAFLYGDRPIYTLEPPWKNNEKFISCIPPETYIVRKHVSPTFGKCFLVCGVKDRTHILIHPLVYYWHTKGCIGVSDWLTDFNKDGYQDLGGPDKKNNKVGSKATLKKLMEILPDEFEMEVRDVE